MARSAAEAVAAIEAEEKEAARLQERRLASLTNALNTLSASGSLAGSSSSEILNLARRYNDFVENGMGNPFDAENEQLQEARELISGWLSYTRAGVQDSKVVTDLIGDSTLWLKKARG